MSSKKPTNLSTPKPSSGLSSAPKKPSTAKNAPTPAYDFGKDIAEATAKFSPAIVFSCFLVGARAQWAEHLRKLEADLGPLSDSVIEEERSSWKPVVRRRGHAPDVRAQKLLAKLSPEDRAALLASLSKTSSNGPAETQSMQDLRESDQG